MVELASLGSWLPFAIVTLVIVFFSTTFTLRYQTKHKRDYLVTAICSISLIIALLTASLLPTDVILVSFMKYRNGTFKDWVQNQTERDAIQNYVEIGYYVLYGLIILMAFFINPFFFFYYEEKEDGESMGKRIWASIKWTIGFLIVLIILVLLGVFVPQIASLPTNSSSDDWDDVKYLVNHFDSSRFQDSISFTIFSISIFGFFLLTIYTGYGTIALPISFIRGKRDARVQQEAIEQQRRQIQSEIDALKKKFPRTATMPSREKRRLVELEGKESALSRNESSIRVVRRSLFFKCRFLYRPLQIVSGVLLLLLALLIFISLLLSDINKSIHFVSFRQIFAHGNNSLPNPIDIILTWTGQFYPANYVILSAFLLYVIFTSVFGLQQLGIWYLWVRMYRFSRGRTRPQALLLLSSLLMFIVLAINIFIYLLLPEYSIYGDQNYPVLESNGTFTTASCSQFVTTDECQTTVMGRILLRLFYKVWFFGAAYFCLSWLYLVIFVISCVVKILRKGESNIQEYNVESFFDDNSDDEDRPINQ